MDKIDRVPSLKELAAGAIVYTYRSGKNRKREVFRFVNDKLYDKLLHVRQKGGDDIAKLLLVIRRCGKCHQFRNWEKVGGVIVDTPTVTITRCSLCLAVKAKDSDDDALSILQDRIGMQWCKHKKKSSRTK